MFRFIIWVARRLGSGRDSGQASSATQLTPGQLVTVRLADGSAVGGAAGAEAGAGTGAQGSFDQQHPTIVLVGQPGGPPPRRSWFFRIPRWLRWTAVIVIVGLFFRKIVAWAVIGALSAVLHLFGANVHLPHINFGWPWSSATSSSVLVGPLVLQKIEGIDKPALGTTTFSFLFTHSVSKPMGFLPCWYSATFYAVGHASATVDLNPGPSWWKRSTGHYVLRVLSKPSGGTPGRVSVSMALPLPQLPQSVHDVSVDDTISRPVSSDHSWTYPGLACGVLIRPQFAQSELYSQAQSVAFQKATQVKSVTQPLIAAAEREATTIIGGNFITPTLNALNYKVSSFTIRWVAPGAGSGASG